MSLRGRYLDLGAYGRPPLARSTFALVHVPGFNMPSTHNKGDKPWDTEDIDKWKVPSPLSSLAVLF